MEEKKVLAKVNGKEFTSENVDEFLKSMGPQRAMGYKSDEGRKMILQEVVNHELLYLYAQDENVEKEEDFLKELESAKAELMKQYVVGKLIKDVTVTEEEMKKHYDDHPSYFKEGESVRASHVLVKSEDKAKEVLAEIKDGLDFAEAAKKYSSCPSSQKGGDLGFFGRGQMVPEFDEACFSMQVGEMSEPIKTQFGYHLIKLVDKKAADTKSYEEVKDSINQALIQMKQNRRYEDKIMDLRQKYKVMIMD